MKPTRIFSAMAVMAVLGTATAAANGTEPDTVKPPVPLVAAPGVNMTPVWVQIPMTGPIPYFLAPPLPMPVQPLPQMTLPPGWGPFVMVWVPLQALQPTAQPALVDYGPVADTPVVELPETVVEPAVPETLLSPAPVVMMPVDAEAASVPGSEVDYGPIAPTPVVDLMALSAPVAVSVPASKPPKKPAVKKNPVRKLPAATVPAKKRMCWTNGVVAPCR